ncbi:MAG: hypothetical protein JSU73_05410 [candidate division WOR-3 bacterium]|nr:MAG: hypothetical protein JSU73_05410 [candidate division WOR-3 bacterium]
MAEKSRSRVVIWTIVGILVVVAVVFLIVARRGGTATGTRSISTEDVPGFVGRMEKSLENEEGRVAKLRAEWGSEYADEFDEIAGLFDKVSASLRDIQDMTDGAAISEKMEEIKTDLGAARDIRKSIGR